jgi:hypothetical protein
VIRNDKPQALDG